ncbi:MAG: 6-phosphogluconolactonase [Verrucomicrobia bacterium]|nr:6-phosphogluconolactonase [Verrucomicrobiota bacterium]
MAKFALIRFSNADELAQAVAAAWLDEIATARQANQAYHVALSGGRITLKLFSAVVELTKARNVPLDHVHFFWADERCVPPDDPESNFRVARERLFAPLKIPIDQIHRIRGEESAALAAAKAEAELCRLAPRDAHGQPVLDLVLLGLGEDGHVASLFPGEPEEIASSQAAYRAVTNSPKPPPQRITLSYAAITAARQVWVLASGSGKQAAVRESLKPTGRIPLARVIQSRQRTQVFSDIQKV